MLCAKRWHVRFWKGIIGRYQESCSVVCEPGWGEPMAACLTWLAMSVMQQQHFAWIAIRNSRKKQRLPLACSISRQEIQGECSSSSLQGPHPHVLLTCFQMALDTGWSPQCLLDLPSQTRRFHNQGSAVWRFSGVQCQIAMFERKRTNRADKKTPAQLPGLVPWQKMFVPHRGQQRHGEARYKIHYDWKFIKGRLGENEPQHVIWTTCHHCHGKYTNDRL